MKVSSIALISTSFLTTLLAIASLVILFVPFPTRTLSDKSHNEGSSSQYTVFGGGYTIYRRDEFPTPTSVSQIITGINTRLATDVHINYDHYQRPTPTIVENGIQAQPTKLPVPLKERQFTGFSGDHFTFSDSNQGFGSGSPFNSGSPFSSSSITVSQSRPAGVAAIILLVAYILLIIEVSDE